MNAALDGSAVTTPAASRSVPGRGFRLTARVFWDLAIYMVGLGLAVGLVFPPFATALGVPDAYAERMWSRAACLVAGSRAWRSSAPTPVRAPTSAGRDQPPSSVPTPVSVRSTAGIPPRSAPLSAVRRRPERPRG